MGDDSVVEKAKGTKKCVVKRELIFIAQKKLIRLR